MTKKSKKNKKEPKPTQQTTLVYIINENRVLLAMKKRGFGQGKWNGAGGKVKGEENVEEAALRETEEELSIKPRTLEKVAEITFFEPNIPGGTWITHIFLTRNWEGEPRESEEMKPQWFTIDKLPFDKMWPDDTFWLLRVLKGEKIVAKFIFDENEEILEKEIISVSEFSSA